MTPFQRIIRNFLERCLSRYDEGPEPPSRLGNMVIAFANMYPKATRGEWIEFTTHMVNECYRSGYVRGYEYVERYPEGWWPDPLPEVIADEMDQNWKWREGIRLDGNPNVEVEDERNREFGE